MGVVAPPVASLRIVVIDDDEDLRETLVEALRERGHAVIGLPAQAGIFPLSDIPPADAWVVNPASPAGSAATWCARCGRWAGTVARPDRRLGQRAGRARVRGGRHDLFLLKPFNPSELADAVARAVAMRRAEANDPR